MNERQSGAGKARRIAGEKSCGKSVSKASRKRTPEEHSPEALQLALKILQSIRASEPQTISDLPVKTYGEGYVEELLRRHCTLLGEHLDTVQIFATVHENGRTTAFTAGVGNEFARNAQIQSWLEDIMGMPPEMEDPPAV